jgi:signal transduction histidine kinase/CheY-like chemotaxis protein/HAMP domain-containing protein
MTARSLVTNGASSTIGPESEHQREDTGAALDANTLLTVLAEVERGDFTTRMPVVWTGVAGKVADALNRVIASNESLEHELARVSRLVGKEGKLSQRVMLGRSGDAWSGCVNSVNDLLDDLVRPTKEMQRVIGAVADGDLSKKISLDAQGEMLELKNTINAMVDQLNGFISEVTRVAREVGTEGKLGQAAAVTIEVGGVWKDLTDNVNIMADNLTAQVRNIADVTTAVANGDLSRKITADVKGEFLELRNTVNAMVDQLNSFAGEVTRVAREVGVEGKLGGQAQSKEVAGVWKDLTDNVNQLAANLTNQVRAISDVATAVTEGDLTRQVSVEASGEVAVLKDKLNEMIRNLRETTRVNTEQDWLKTNLERFTRLLQGQRDLSTVSDMILSELAPLVLAQHGVLYTMGNGGSGEQVLGFQASYGYEERKHLSKQYAVGVGLVGQCAKEKRRILLTDVPRDYIRISSGLGDSTPLNIIVLPVLFEGSVRAVIELASFSRFSAIHQAFLDQLTESIGLVLNTIEANTLTETLLKQSQSQAQELQAQQEELRSSNEDLGTQARQLEEKNIEVERKNEEVEISKRQVEDKAEQLAISSKYKSEFLASMSHELRTPLNSLLILAEQLQDNPTGNLTDKQVEYASIIRSSGSDLLTLLNDILDLAKVESGTVRMEMSAVDIREIRDSVTRDYAHVAESRKLGFSVTVDEDVPDFMTTDPDRLRQVLKNLLSNAFKFTHHGRVSLQMRYAAAGWSPGHAALDDSGAAVAFAVSDSGIGIAPEQHRQIFEAFAQADGATSRSYGGTGLGLSISRELVQLMGGEITLSSSPGQGSVFTVYLPIGDPNAKAAVHIAPGKPLRKEPSKPMPSRFAIVLPGPTPAPRAPVADVVAHEAPAAVAAPPEPIAAPPPAPERSAPAADLAPAVEIPTQAGSSEFTALVVDDDARNVYALSVLLERHGITVIGASGGREAIATLQGTAGIDIVFMDIMMPLMDGYDTMRALRALPEFADLPIIAVTAKVGADEEGRCSAAGASSYVPKPIDTSTLNEAVARWLPHWFGPLTPHTLS